MCLLQTKAIVIYAASRKMHTTFYAISSRNHFFYFHDVLFNTINNKHEKLNIFRRDCLIKILENERLHEMTLTACIERNGTTFNIMCQVFKMI